MKLRTTTLITRVRVYAPLFSCFGVTVGLLSMHSGAPATMAVVMLHIVIVVLAQFTAEALTSMNKRLEALETKKETPQKE